MKKSILTFFFLCSISLFLSAQQPTYSRVKIYTDAKSPAQLFATGIEITEADPGNHWYMAEISQKEIEVISASGFRYEVIIPDMVKFYTERFSSKAALSENDILLNQAWPEPANFTLGSCGGFSTVDEMNQQLDLMHSLYPSLISVKQALSDTVTTIEGRTVYYVRISDNPAVNESEPEVLYTGMHHAREPIGMQHLLYYMWYLLESYNLDPEIKDLVDNTEMYFVPVFNVDGYSYNITTNPNGFGYWRKNRRNNGDGSFGIDINRNYGYKWGNDDAGSSPNPGAETYRGTAPFSEPETRMMKYFCESHNFQIALNYHSYANLCLSPWGWTEAPCADSSIFDAYGDLLTKENGYNYGPGSTTIYPTNGGSDDWMYGEQLTKPAILSYTPEVGNNSDGFWPTQQRIIPLIQQNMFASITAARLTRNYGTISDESPLFIWDLSGYLPFKVKRFGLMPGTLTASITPLGNAFASVGGPKTFSELAMLEGQYDSISYQFSNSIQVGDTIQYVLHISNGTFVNADTITRIFGYPVAVFNDNLENSNLWTGTWATSTEQSYSPTSSMTDSPGSSYTGGDNKTIQFDTEVDLPHSLMMVLQFRAKWILEEDYDYVQISISTTNGASWIPLEGKYSKMGSSYQTVGLPVYDGQKKGEWVREVISLNEYMGSKIKIRFKLKADIGKEYDGFYFDDFNISMLLDPTQIGETENANVFLGNPFPNPSTEHFEVSYAIPQQSSDVALIISTTTGLIVSRTMLSQQTGTAVVDIHNLAKGIYFVRIESAGVQSAVRKLVVQ